MYSIRKHAGFHHLSKAWTSFSNQLFWRRVDRNSIFPWAFYNHQLCRMHWFYRRHEWRFSPNSDTSAGTKAAADGAYDTQKIRRYCDEQGIEPLIPVRIDFAGKANGCMPRKEAGFRQLGDLDCMDKTAERKFQASRANKRGNSRRRGAGSQGTTTGGQSRLYFPRCGCWASA